MDLKTFIKETLRDINEAIREAQEEEAKISGAQAQIIPRWTTGPEAKEVSFDIALTETESEGAEGRLGVFLGGIVGGSMKGETRGESSSLSRIQFQIPVIFPCPSKRE